MHLKSKTHKELAKLLIQSQEGDTSAFAEIYESTVKQQYYLAFKILKNEANAEDVTQEVYIYLFEHLKNIMNPIALISYMNKINYRLCLRALDKAYEGCELNENIEVSEDVDKKSKESIQNLLESAMFELDTKTREVVFLKYIQEFKTSEIADHLKVSQRTVQRLIKDGVNAMKKNLQISTQRQYGIAIFCLPYLSKIINQSMNNILSFEIETRMLSHITSGLGLPTIGVGAVAMTGTFVGGSTPLAMSKIIIGSTVATATIYTGYNLIQPHFKIIAMQNSTNYSIVNRYQIQPEFGTNIKQVIVYNENMDEYINYQGQGSAEISITRNGNYTIRVVDDKNMINEKKVSINNIDNICPSVVVSFHNGDVVLNVLDSHSGIDYESLEIVNEQGEHVQSIRNDNEIRFPNTSSTKISVKDKLGNETVVTIKK